VIENMTTGEKHIKDGDHLNNSTVQDRVLAYLSGEITEEERKQLEEAISDPGVEQDAIEGLMLMGSEEARNSRERISRRVQKALKRQHRKAKWRGARTLGSGVLLIAFLVLILMIIAFTVVFFTVHGK
jgi:anti-sigma factor RsiW